jgi:hypothetical protein
MRMRKDGEESELEQDIDVYLRTLMIVAVQRMVLLRIHSKRHSRCMRDSDNRLGWEYEHISRRYHRARKHPREVQPLGVSQLLLVKRQTRLCKIRM